MVGVGERGNRMDSSLLQSTVMLVLLAPCNFEGNDRGCF